MSSPRARPGRSSNGRSKCPKRPRPPEMATQTRRPGAPSGNGDSSADTQTAPAETRAPAAPLDMLLSEAAVGPVQRWYPGMAGVKAAAKLALQPGTVARRGAALAVELTKVAVGRSDVGPAKTDRRFNDPAWSD